MCKEAPYSHELNSASSEIRVGSTNHSAIRALLRDVYVSQIMTTVDVSSVGKCSACEYLHFIAFMPSEYFYLNSLDRSISSDRAVWLGFVITVFYRNACTKCKQCRP